ncbi:hypothetical protein ACFLQ4_00235 [Bacteroidota bacterium]
MKFHNSYSNYWLALFFILVILCSSNAQTQFTSCNTSQPLPDDYLTANFIDQDSLINDEPENIGAWFQLGLGSASANLNYRFNPSSFTQLTLSLHVRKNKSLFSLGAESATTFSSWKINTYWGSYGYALYSTYIDGSISAGLSYSDWQYNTEDDTTGIIHSPGSIGLIIKAQILPHLPMGLGLGLVFTFNASKEVEYTSISLVLAIGSWSL